MSNKPNFAVLDLKMRVGVQNKPNLPALASGVPNERKVRPEMAKAGPGSCHLGACTGRLI